MCWGHSRQNKGWGAWEECEGTRSEMRSKVRVLAVGTSGSRLRRPQKGLCILLCASWEGSNPETF